MENKDLKNTENFDLMSSSKKNKTRRYKKKKHGVAGFFQKMGENIADWWKGLQKWQKITVCGFSSVVAVALVLVIVLFTAFGYNYNNITANPDDLGFEQVLDNEIINIALFGIDTRDKDCLTGNSDSIMVLSINAQSKTVKIVSIMRDSLVPIERKEKTTYNKINSAYAFGGPELAIKTINQNFGLDISEYATVNFFGMGEIIDAVGGIEAELTKDEVRMNNAYAFNDIISQYCLENNLNANDYYIKTPGKHHLNGVQAVAYSRIRRAKNIWGTNNDFGRTDRQRYVMEQLFNKALTLSKSQYVKLAKALIPYTETSLSYGEIISLATNVLLESPTFEQSRMPMNEYQMSAPTIRGVGSCVYYDLDFAKNILHAFFYDNITPEEYIKLNGISKNDWYKKAVSGNSGNISNRNDKEEITSSEPIKDEPSVPNNTSGESQIDTSSEVSQDQPSDESSDDSSTEESSGEEENKNPDESAENSSENTVTE